MSTQDRIDQLLVDCGRALNANNGQCTIIEDALTRATSLLLELENINNKLLLSLAIIGNYHPTSWVNSRELVKDIGQIRLIARAAIANAKKGTP